MNEPDSTPKVGDVVLVPVADGELCCHVSGEGPVIALFHPFVLDSRVWSEPTSGAWNSYTVNGAGGDLGSISCPTATFCVAAGNDAGDALVSTDPTGGPAAWTSVLADPISCPPSTACGTEAIIASDRTGIHTLDASTEFEAQTGAQLTGLTLTGDTLSWRHSGSLRTYTLAP
jgi:hypothetical protein